MSWPPVVLVILLYGDGGPTHNYIQLKWPPLLQSAILDLISKKNDVHM